MKPKKSNPSKPNLAYEDAWMSIVESIVLFLVTWLDPQTEMAIFALKLCFQILKTLRHYHRPPQKSPKQRNWSRLYARVNCSTHRKAF
jgi:hypothetical protein